MHNGCAFAPGVNVSLSRQGIILGQLCVCSKTAVQQMPAVLCVLPVQIGVMIVVLVARENAIAGAFGAFSTVLLRAEPLRLRSSSARQQLTSLLRALFHDA